MSIIWLIRHGQASFGASDYDRLSETGIRQSKITGNFFKDAGVLFKASYSGKMRRQIDTAKYALDSMDSDLAPVVKTNFDEYDFSSIIKSQLPGLIARDPSVEEDLNNIFNDNKSFQRFFSRIMDRWVSGKYDVEGVESYTDYQLRVRRGLAGIAEENEQGGHIALFTSGGVVSLAMQQALNLSDRGAMELGWHIMNASVSKFKYSNGSLTLLMFNQLSHLECEAIPELLTYR